MAKTRYKYFSAVAALIILLIIFLLWRILFLNSIETPGDRAIIYIPTGANYNQVKDSLYANLKVRNKGLLEWVALRKNYPRLIKPGRYVIEKNMSYLKLINMLRSGDQKPVKVTFNNLRNIFQLSGRIAKQIEPDSVDLASFLSEPENYKNDGFSPEDVIAVFLPNTYELYWNTTPQAFYERMLKEYHRFWTEERLAKARSENLTTVQVAILASIIDDEVAKSDEKPRIAGVYLNRLRRGMPLQACPTIKFALNDFTITRVLNKYLQADSPYNTYKHTGFPPGPIGCSTIDGLNAVLNAEKHDYLYFAAKADFSGYHNFSRTLTEHNRYAAEYQKELDRRGIFK